MKVMNSNIKNIGFCLMFYILACIIFVLKNLNELEGVKSNLYYYGIVICLAISILFLVRLIVSKIK